MIEPVNHPAPTSLVPTLARMTGLGPATVQDIWAQVKANHAKLDACPDHDFVCDDAVRRMGSHYSCTRCQGRVSGTDYSWYMKGRAHQGAQPLPGPNHMQRED